MNALLKNNIAKLWQQGGFSHITGIKRGFEKETLRVDLNGRLAQTPHPKALGSSLTHPMITTDYSEALLEFVTPPTRSVKQLFKDLIELHQYVYQILDDEFLWLASMPCLLPNDEEIPIANYGRSNVGQLKHVYRKGLGLRYGRRMQTIAGIHYNFSFPMEFWQAYNSNCSPAVISEQYLALLRNGLRLGFIIPFFFGASPAVCSSFIQDRKYDFLQPARHTPSSGHHKNPHNDITGTFLGPFATSLRLSDIGYQNKKQTANTTVSYNSMDEFLDSLHTVIHTVNPEYEKYGVKVGNEWRQLSACYLQAEDEHYAWLRPKRVSGLGERMFTVLQQKGIEYIELRTLDINPFKTVGIDQETIHFLDIFLLMCLLLPSPKITSKEDSIIKQNFSQVVKWGRKPGLTLINLEQDKEMNLIDWIKYILEDMEVVAETMDRAEGGRYYRETIDRMRKKLYEINELPSAKAALEIEDKNLSYFDFVARYSRMHEGEFKAEAIESQRQQFFAEMAKNSLNAQAAIEGQDKISFDEYLLNFLRA